MTAEVTRPVTEAPQSQMAGAPAQQVTLRILRGSEGDVHEEDFSMPVETGWVVLDAVLYVQAHMAPDLAVRWNCKAAKCGSCSAEINGKPRLMCKTRLDDLDLSQPVVVHPMKTFPHIKDLVTNVSWNYEVNKRIQPFTPKTEGEFVYFQEDIDRTQEMRKCIECFLCQNVCHVLRNHERYDRFAGPRYLVRLAGLEMHPMDAGNRLKFIDQDAGVFLCNITKCCTEVCPEEIHITDNAIIPLKERVIDEKFDPIRMVLKKLTGK